MTGVNHFIEDVAMDGSPHIRVFNPLQVKDDNIIDGLPSATTTWNVVHHQRVKDELPRVKDALHLITQLEALPGIEGVAPQASTQVFFNNGPLQISGIMNGIDVKKQQQLFNLESKMSVGNLEELLVANDAILLGFGLAKKMNARLGDRISITTPQGNHLLLRVAGIFSYGLGQLDETKSFAAISTVQKVLQKSPSYITDLHIRLTDHTAAKEMADQIQDQYGVHTEDWETANASIMASDKIRNVMTGVVSFTLLLVAGFGIYNIMNMNIVNKLKDISILKATGFQSKDIIAIFLLQSIMIGISGGLLGITVGYGLCSLLDITPFPEGDFFRMKDMPVNFDPRFYAFGIVFGFITTLIAGYFPALKASRIDPVEIIRG
jgi:lipoprotein-releasing system permease protein